MPCGLPNLVTYLTHHHGSSPPPPAQTELLSAPVSDRKPETARVIQPVQLVLVGQVGSSREFRQKIPASLRGPSTASSLKQLHRRCRPDLSPYLATFSSHRTMGYTTTFGYFSRQKKPCPALPCPSHPIPSHTRAALFLFLLAERRQGYGFDSTHATVSRQGWAVTGNKICSDSDSGDDEVHYTTPRKFSRGLTYVL